MQLNLTTDYAIRALLHLAEQRRVVTSQELADFAKVSPNYIFKVMKMLRDAGYVEQLRGVKGGYMLVKEPDTITLLDVIQLMEPTTFLNRCLEPDHFCSRDGVGVCPVHDIYSAFQKKVEAFLRSFTIQSILNQKPGRRVFPAAAEAFDRA